MEFVEKVRSFSADNGIFDGRSLIVGCSGGADSVALLRVLPLITSSDIYVVHVNHCLREDADRDQRFVEELCESLDIPCKVFKFNVSKESKTRSRSIEDTGRILRYEAFESCASELFGDEKDQKSVICLAHHKDDLSETMLMNVFRGSGLEGLLSPRAVSDRVIRPFLCVSKKEILEYLDSLGQPHCEDVTNQENCCTRNIWRNKILPEISDVSVKEPSEALFETYRLLSDDMDLIDGLVAEKLENCLDRKHFVLDISVFEGCHKAISTRLIRALWKETFGDLVDFEQKHVQSVLELCTDNGPSGRSIDLPFSRKAFVTGGFLGFCKAAELQDGLKRAVMASGLLVFDEKTELTRIADTKNTTILPKSFIKINYEIVENIEAIRYNTNSWFCPFFSSDLLEEISIGPIDRNMTFKRAGTDLTTKVDKLLGSYKVPGAVKDLILGVVKGDEVLWIPGVGHANGFTDNISRDKFLEDAADKGKTKYLVIRLTEVEA